MSFHIEELRKYAARGPIARVVIVDVSGSVPRGAGTSMVVTRTDAFGTIGGGALEHDAIAEARACLHVSRSRLTKTPLGPSLGQCCGGSVTLLTEVWTSERLDHVTGDIAARPMPGKPVEKPASVARIEAQAKDTGALPAFGVVDDWIIEPVTRPDWPIWIFGAGHVGRALTAVLAPLPRVAVTLIDDRPERFPPHLPDIVAPLVAQDPADAVEHAPENAIHFVMTYSHALDLEICHRVLSREFRSLGLIGSATKGARFRKRLLELGHPPAVVDRLQCPIGDPNLGKHPYAIAVGVATGILQAQKDRGSKAGRQG